MKVDEYSIIIATYADGEGKMTADIPVKGIKPLFRSFMPPFSQLISRPKDIPPLAPDCGWNHGEPKKKDRRGFRAALFHRLLSGDLFLIAFTGDQLEIEK